MSLVIKHIMESIGLIDRDIWGVDPFYHTATKIFNKPIKIDLEELPDRFYLRADVPGLDKGGVTVEYDSNRDTLTIIVVGDVITNNAPGLIHFKERDDVGSTRVIPFQRGVVDKDGIDAKCNNGVLTITLNKYIDNDVDSGKISIDVS